MAKEIIEEININVFNIRDNEKITFLMSVHKPFKTLMQRYCKKSGHNLDSLKFSCVGQPLDENSTPASLELKDGDVIDCNYDPPLDSDLE